MEESRLATVEHTARAYATLGEHHRAAAVLKAQAVMHPMRESLAAALMTALYRAGRQSEALDWFHRTRRLLADVRAAQRRGRLLSPSARQACSSIPASTSGSRGVPCALTRTGTPQSCWWT